MDVIAIKTTKGVPKTQRFSQYAWDLLGPDKNGWVEVGSQKIENIVENQKRVNAGKDQVIDNTIVKQPESVISDKSDKKPIVKVSEEKREAFMKHIKGYGKGSIKDYFDSLTPPVKYDNKAALPALQEQFGEHFKFDIVEFQKSFS